MIFRISSADCMEMERSLFDDAWLSSTTACAVEPEPAKKSKQMLPSSHGTRLNKYWIKDTGFG